MSTLGNSKYRFNILLLSGIEAEKTALENVFVQTSIDCIVRRVTTVDVAMTKLANPEDYQVAILSATPKRDVSGKIFPHEKAYIGDIERLVEHLREFGHRYSDVPVIIMSEDGLALSEFSKLCAFTPASVSALSNRESCGKLLSAVTGNPHIAELLNEANAVVTPVRTTALPALHL